MVIPFYLNPLIAAGGIVGLFGSTTALSYKCAQKMDVSSEIANLEANVDELVLDTQGSSLDETSIRKLLRAKEIENIAEDLKSSSEDFSLDLMLASLGAGVSGAIIYTNPIAIEVVVGIALTAAGIGAVGAWLNQPEVPDVSMDQNALVSPVYEGFASE